MSSMLGDELLNPRPKFGYTAGAYYTRSLNKDWKIYSEFVGNFKGSNFSNGFDEYSSIALFYMDLAILPMYDIVEDKQAVSIGPYISYLGLSSLYLGEQKKSVLNDLDLKQLDYGLAIYYTAYGNIVGFQIGAKWGIQNINDGINFIDIRPQTGTNGTIQNLGIEIGMLF